MIFYFCSVWHVVSISNGNGVGVLEEFSLDVLRVNVELSGLMINNDKVRSCLESFCVMVSSFYLFIYF